MTDMPRIPRETPAEYAERHRRAANDGRPDRIAELAADMHDHQQRAAWGLLVIDAIRVSAALGAGQAFGVGTDEGVVISGDHRPALGRPWWARASNAVG